MPRKQRYSTEQIITKLREADVLLSKGKSAEEIAAHAGFRYFTDVDSFREYVKREILALEIEPD